MSTEKNGQSKRADPEFVKDASQRLATIVEAAEQAAATVIDDAEKQARERLEEAELRANRLIAERLRMQADELDPPGGDERRERPHLRSVESEAGSRSDGAAPSQGTADSGARLLATQMAVSGASREEIAERLRTGLGIEDPGPLLEAVLGPED
jgi:hypothetical protein